MAGKAQRGYAALQAGQIQPRDYTGAVYQAPAPMQYSATSPGAGWIYDHSTGGWYNPTGAPGASFVSATRTQDLTPAQRASNLGAAGDRQSAVQAALSRMTPEQRQAAIQAASATFGGGAAPAYAGGGLLATSARPQATQNPLLGTPVRTSGGGPGPVPGRTTATAQSGGGQQMTRQQQVQAALANMPPQVRQMMIQRALMQQGGVPGMGGAMPGQFQPASMGSFGGGYTAQPALPGGWGAMQPTPFTQGNYIPPMQMVNPNTGQAQGGPMFGQASPFGAPQPFWFGNGG